MNHEAFHRTAPATSGLLNILNHEYLGNIEKPLKIKEIDPSSVTIPFFFKGHIWDIFSGPSPHDWRTTIH